MRTGGWSQRFRGLGAITIVLLLATQSSGLAFELKDLAFWRGGRPETLIVTGNYAKPRLLAEQAQAQTNLPVILVSQEGRGDEVYYLPAEPSAMRLNPSKYLEFVEVMIRPERIIIIGDEEYVPSKYVDVLKERYPTIRITGNDWIANAEQLGKILRTGFLARNYRRNLMQLMEAEAHEPVLEDYHYQMPSMP